MRQQGCVHTAEGFGTSDHVCWSYETGEEFRAAGVDWLRDGARLGQRLVNLGCKDEATLRADVEALGDVDAKIADGRLLLVPVEGDPAGESVAPEGQLALYSALTDAALADGYSGLRVLGDVSGLLTDRSAVDAHLRWEGVAERYMASHPMSAMCCFDRTRLGDEAIRDLACLHPIVHAPEDTAPFRLFTRDGAVAVAGEVDYFTTPLLKRLAAAIAPPGGMELDLADLAFADHSGALALSEHGALRNVPPGMRRLFDLLGLTP